MDEQLGPDNQGDSSHRAVMYVRMSTDHQKYSIENQIITMNLYAERMGLYVIETYADEGKSGLTFEKRDSLKRLINKVKSGQATFENILIFDVSRWGRFQDIDESAYYEHTCRREGIKIHFVAEQFQDDGTSLAALTKTIKRIMAAEYSRELSAKVFAGQTRLAEKGFHTGGVAGYGLRRVLVDHKGNKKGILKYHERKSIQSDRVILAPGPQSERRIVNWIFKKFAEPSTSTPM